MKLSLKNIGKIGMASVDISGITVIAGENNTGKSTVGRALYAVFNSFYNIHEQITDERVKNTENLLALMYLSLTSNIKRRPNVNEIANDIIKHIDWYRKDSEALSDFIIQILRSYNEKYDKVAEDKTVLSFISRIKEGLNIPDIEIFKSVLGKKLDAEFNGQINNIFSEDIGEITLSIKNTDVSITVENNSIRNIKGEINLHTEAIYIDDPFVLDEISDISYFAFESNYLSHRADLKRKLIKEDNANIIEEIIVNRKLEDIYQKISDVCSGNIVSDKRAGLGYQRKNTDKILNVKNLSTGFKTFAILKTLLLNSTIDYNGILILDEPEIHLHPEWQLLFAELIVLIQKEFGVHILLNTHSPYFLNAIEVYAAKYGVDDKCRYYLAVSRDDLAAIEDVTDNIEAIYSKLARPLQELENERGCL